MFAFLKSQNTQKIIALLLFIILLAAIPLTVWYGQQQQISQNRAASVIPREQHYACGSYLTVLLSAPTENPDCSGNGGNVSGLTSFQSTEIIRAQSGSQGAYQVKWAWAQFWCPTEDPHAPCLSNGTLKSGQGGLTGDNAAYVTAVSDTKSPTADFTGQACGYYQNDFGFQVFDNNDPNTRLCGVSIDLNSLGQTNNNASWCHSGKTCETVTPTDTPTDTPTSTPTATPTPPQHHECRQNACVLVPNSGSDLCTSDSDCATTTPTNTPNPSSSPTPTSTPGPTSTPMPPTTTPKPTLPPTGPGNVIVGIGLVGAVAAVVGTIVILAL